MDVLWFLCVVEFRFDVVDFLYLELFIFGNYYVLLFLGYRFERDKLVKLIYYIVGCVFGIFIGVCYKC